MRFVRFAIEVWWEDVAFKFEKNHVCDSMVTLDEGEDLRQKSRRLSLSWRHANPPVFEVRSQQFTLKIRGVSWAGPGILGEIFGVPEDVVVPITPETYSNKSELSTSETISL